MVGKRLGIDEAGRGPAIGPLVLAGVLVDERQEERLIELGVQDSKALSRARRTELAAEIRALAAQVLLIPLAPATLTSNLNRVERLSMARLIRRTTPDVVLIDAPVGPPAIPTFVRQLRVDTCGFCGELIAENRADVRYPAVSAASIIAKVYRDEAVLRLHQLYGDFGWGYPAETKTQTFLRDWYETHEAFPPCVRRKWSTVRRIIYDARAETLFEPVGTD